jgi:hypothetical protein
MQDLALRGNLTLYFSSGSFMGKLYENKMLLLNIINLRYISIFTGYKIKVKKIFIFSYFLFT